MQQIISKRTTVFSTKHKGQRSRSFSRMVGGISYCRKIKPEHSSERRMPRSLGSWREDGRAQQKSKNKNTYTHKKKKPKRKKWVAIWFPLVADMPRQLPTSPFQCSQPISLPATAISPEGQGTSRLLSSPNAEERRTVWEWQVGLACCYAGRQPEPALLFTRDGACRKKTSSCGPQGLCSN